MAQPTTHSNLIIPSFALDLLVVFVDGIFFLMNLFVHICSRLPIFVSRDLKTWKYICKSSPDILEIQYTKDIKQNELIDLISSVSEKLQQKAFGRRQNRL
jgi:hypothetical protein